MTTFVRAMECWVPNKGRLQLELSEGWYGGVPSYFGPVSQKCLFGRGEGLPGRAWDAGEPILLPRLEGSYFQRASTAEAASITCALALPIFAGDFLTSVLVILCGDNEDQAGAIELWRNTPTESPDMNLVEGYYGATDDSFGFLSRRTSFREGTGLPGLVWQRNTPVLIEDLGKSSVFLRRDEATRVGINRGLGIPCSTLTNNVSVVTFLSALGTPIARRLEIWLPDESHRYVYRGTGFCEHAGHLAEARAESQTERAEGTIGRAFLTGVPAFSDSAASEFPLWMHALETAGITVMAAIPLIARGRLKAILAWYF